MKGRGSVASGDGVAVRPPESAASALPARGHSTAGLVAAGIGAAAACLAGAAGPIAFGVAIVALTIGAGRRRGWAISRWLDRPKFFLVVSAMYIPFFPIDILLSYRTSPVSALVRLIVFLLMAEVLTGDGRFPHRPVLFGLLFLMAAAAETTDVWFAIPIVAFSIASIASQIRATLAEDQPSGVAAPTSSPLSSAIPISVASLILGSMIFFIIPRTAWGQRPASANETARIETGLSEEVSLGTLGRVKRRTSVAFRARIEGGVIAKNLDPASIYWRGHAFSRWTGAGWARDESENEQMLALPADLAVPLPGETLRTKPGLIVEINRVHLGAETLLSPGRPLWIRSARSAQVLVGKDGTLRGLQGTAPRVYEIAVRDIEAFPGAPRGGGALIDPGTAPSASPTHAGSPGSNGNNDDDGGDGDDTSTETPEPPEVVGPPGTPTEATRAIARLTSTRRLDPPVARWAQSVAPSARSARELASAFVADLASRSYSLDTTAIDPQHPIASFLAGAPGHCEYFASAMALGMRSRGVPARVVSGFLGADRVVFGNDLIVRDSRAHLWVEVLLPGDGWSRFDPTPASGRYLSTGGWVTLRAISDRTAILWDSWIVGLDLDAQIEVLLEGKEKARRLIESLKEIAPRPNALARGLAIVAAAALLMRQLRKSRGVVKDLPRLYRRLLRLAARRGIKLSPSETAEEFGQRAGAALGDHEAVRVINRLYERERFGGVPISPAEFASAVAGLRRIAGSSRTPLLALAKRSALRS